jgi:hypothetical protein
MEDKDYFVVEFRLAKRIDSAKSPEDAADQACKAFEKEYGIGLSKWFCRVFKYSTEALDPEEFFFNPAGVKAYNKDSNIKEHEEINGRQDSK